MRVHEPDMPFLNLHGGEKSQVTIKKKEQVEEWRLFYQVINTNTEIQELTQSAIRANVDTVTYGTEMKVSRNKPIHVWKLDFKQNVH